MRHVSSLTNSPTVCSFALHQVCCGQAAVYLGWSCQGNYDHSPEIQSFDHGTEAQTKHQHKNERDERVLLGLFFMILGVQKLTHFLPGAVKSGRSSDTQVEPVSNVSRIHKQPSRGPSKPFSVQVPSVCFWEGRAVSILFHALPRSRAPWIACAPGPLVSSSVLTTSSSGRRALVTTGRRLGWPKRRRHTGDLLEQLDRFPALKAQDLIIQRDRGLPFLEPPKVAIVSMETTSQLMNF